MRRPIARTAALLAFLLPAATLAGMPAEVEVYDRTADCVLPVYWKHGERYIAGEPGHRYEIRLRNREGGRLLAVTSVDGVNVISGETASHGQTGYVLDGYGAANIDGWRKSLADVAVFYFTALPDSYAARTGRPDNVGVIGVALFRERIRYPEVLRAEPLGSVERERADAPASSAPPQEADGSGVTGRLRKSERLGTGHGERRDSSVRYVDFERARESPDAVIRIFYDSHRNLVAQGVIPRRFDARRVPDPFPAAFVPDP